jgi:predicted membrane protein
MEPLGLFFIVLCVIGFFFAIISTKQVGRSFADRLALLLCIDGLVLIVFALADASPGLGTVFWAGGILLGMGILIWRSSPRKICPKCAKRVKFEASDCAYCGHHFGTFAAISERFYKGEADSQ